MQQILVPPSPNWYGAHMADWAPEVGLYAYAAQNTVVMLNSRAQTVRTMLSGHAGRVTAVAFAGAAVPGAAAASPAEQAERLPLLVSAAADRSLRLWNLNTMQRLRALYKRPAEVTALAATSDGGTALVGDKQGTLWAWDLSDPAAKPVKLARCKHTAAVACLAAAPLHSAAGGSSGLVLAGYVDGSVALLDWRQDRLVQRLERHAQDVQCVRWAAAPDPAAAAAVAAAREALSRETAAAATREAEAAAAEAAANLPDADGSADEPAEQTAAGEPAGSAATAEQQAEADATPAAAAAAEGTAPAAEEAPAAATPDAVPSANAAAGAAGDAALADPVAAAAAALQAAQQALAAASPAWEVLLSSGADGALRLYGFARGSASSMSSGNSTVAAPQLQLLTTLRLPRPPPGLPTGQSNRLWFSAAVVPPPLPEPCKAASAGSDAAAPAAAGTQPIWLVSSGHAGTLLAWKVPLPSAAATASAAAEAAAAAEARAAAFGRRGPAAGPPQPAIPAVQPSRLPISHGRTVFTVHAASALQPKPAPVAAAGSGETAEQQQQPEEEEQQPVLQLLTTSMDRSVFMSQLPHPGAAAAAAVQVAAPEGSWRRDAAVGAAASAAWHKLALTWRLTGLGGHVYSLGLLAPPLPAAAVASQPAGQPADEPPPPPPEQQQSQQEQQQGGGGEEDSTPPPPPPPAAAEPAEGDAAAAGTAAEQPPPPPPAADPAAAAAAETPQQQQPEQQPVAAPGPQQVAEAAQPAPPEPLLLALGCGDRTIRVQPVPAPGTPHTTQQTAQLLLWQNIPDKVTAVAWQPPLPAPAAPAPASQKAAAAGLAFGCGDGSLGLMLPSQERSMLLPVKHKGAVMDLCWTPAPAATPDAAEQPTAQLYSLSADGALLLWGPVPLPLIELFSSGKSAGGGAGSSAASWSAPGRPAAAALASPLDLRTHLAAAAAAEGGAAASWISSQQQLSITAFAVLQPGSPAAAATGGSHLLAVALAGGGVAVLSAEAVATAAGEPALRLLWASGGAAGAANVSHLCFSADGWQLATAAESGTVSVHPWAAEAGLFPAEVAADALVAAAAASVQLDSTVTALAWTPGKSGGSSSSDSSGSGSQGDPDVPGCGSGGMLAAAVVVSGAQASGGIQLLDLRVSGGSSSSSQGSLVPTALLRGHSAPIRCLEFLPPQEQPEQQAEAQPAGSETSQQGQPAQLEQEHQQPEQPERHAPQPLPPKRFLLTGSEDQSVRLYDIQRQLAAWQQRQAAAAAAAAEAEAEAKAAKDAAAAAAATVAAAAPVQAPPPAVVEAPAAETPLEAGPVAAAAADEGMAPHVPASSLLEAVPAADAAATEAAPAAPLAPAPEVPPPPPPVATPTVSATAAPAAARVAPAAAPAPATAAAPGSKKKAATSSLGARPILPTAQAVGGGPRQQHEAQQACLQLAQQLAQDQWPAEAAEPGVPPPPPAPPAPAAAALLDCAPDPLTASLALHQAAADLGASAATAQSAPSRLALAQRAAAAALFRGDVGAAMQLLLEHDALTADFVSLSTAAGPAAWRAVTLAWAAKLEQQFGEPHLAALHLLAVQEVVAAVQVYRRAGLLREALALAAARLLPGHPLLSELHAAYAAQLSSQGQHEQAAAHHLAAGHWAAAAAVLSARGTASGAAAAMCMCRQALEGGSSLPEGERARLEHQLAEAELALAARAVAEGTTPAAALAALEPPQQYAAVASAEAVDTGTAPTAGGKAGRQRYSPEQLLAVGGRAAGGTAPRGLPEDLAATAAAQPATIANEPAVFGRTGASRQRYSLQTLLMLSVDADAAATMWAAARQALPADLLKEDSPDA